MSRRSWMMNGWLAMGWLLIALFTACRPFADLQRDKLLQIPASPDAIASQPEIAPDSQDSLEPWRVRLAEPSWAQNVPEPGTNKPPEWRWHHPGVDAWMALPPERRPDLHSFLSDADAAVRSNVAIVLARSGDPAGQKQLAAAAQNIELKLPLRRAAVEALGALATDGSRMAVVQIIKEASHAADSSPNAYLPELHADALRALASDADSAELVAAMRSPAAVVRLAAVDSWSRRAERELPQRLLDLRADPDSRVRIAVLRALAEVGHPRAVEHARNALNDVALEVRLAAIDALGQSRDAAAQVTLEETQRQGSDYLRAAATEALALHGNHPALERATNDASWLVRKAVATALADEHVARDGELLRRLLVDASTEVQKAAVEALDGWPLPEAGPLYLHALEKSHYMTRKLAIEQWGSRWPAAHEYSLDLPVERRADAFASLQAAWQRDFDHVAAGRPSAAAASQASGGTQDSPPAAELRRWIEQLRAPEAIVRRAAAEHLRTAALANSLPRELAREIAGIGAVESDELTVRWLLDAVDRSDDDAALSLAAAAASHPSAEARRLACDVFNARPSAANAAILLPALEDPNSLVVIAAIHALSHPGVLPDGRPLERMLVTPDSRIRVEVARGLALIGSMQADAALERLSYDRDADVRRRLADVLGELKDPRHAGILIRMLEDGLTRSAALRNLPLAAGENVGKSPPPGTSPSAEIECEHWRAWWRERISGGRVAG